MLNKRFIFVGGFVQEDIDTLKFILKQNTNIHVLKSDLISNTIKNVVTQFSNQNLLQVIDLAKLEIKKILNSIKEDIVVDFTANANDISFVEIINNILSDVPDYVYLVRPVHECVSIQFKKSGYEDFGQFIRDSNYSTTIKNTYLSILNVSELYSEKTTIIDVDNLRDKSADVLKELITKLNIPNSKYKFKIESILYPRVNYLGDNVLTYKQPKFWNPLHTEEKDTDLDVSLHFSLQGKFDISEKKLDEFLAKYPKNYRGLFNKGLFEMMKGNLLKGHQCMYEGRFEGVYGNKPPIPGLPEWKGEENKTVLFYLEGGLGDEIHFVRFVKQIRARNCKVITCCEKSLVNLFRYVDGIDIIIDRSQVNDFIYDCYVPGMSCIVPLGLEYKDIDNEPYINIFDTNVTNQPPRIGLRWRGNPDFEHEQHRLFPSHLLFNAVSNLNANFISLQKDVGAEETPNWVERVKLDTWIDTAKEISRCDFIVTSCTSVAHLAGAMGKRTYIMVPILPYFIWATPGEKSVYYKNVRLFRQTVAQSWNEPFKKLNEVLEYETRYHLANAQSY